MKRSVQPCFHKGPSLGRIKEMRSEKKVLFAKRRSLKKVLLFSDDGSTLFSDDRILCLLLCFGEESLALTRRCFHCSFFIRFYFLRSDISFAWFFGTRSVAVVVAFLSDSVFGVANAFSTISVFRSLHVFTRKGTN